MVNHIALLSKPNSPIRCHRSWYMGVDMEYIYIIPPIPNTDMQIAIHNLSYEQNKWGLKPRTFLWFSALEIHYCLAIDFFDVVTDVMLIIGNVLKYIFVPKMGAFFLFLIRKRVKSRWECVLCHPHLPFYISYMLTHKALSLLIFVYTPSNEFSNTWWSDCISRYSRGIRNTRCTRSKLHTYQTCPSFDKQMWWILW